MEEKNKTKNTSLSWEIKNNNNNNNNNASTCERSSTVVVR